jgi:malonate transporter and related proteins
MLAIVAIVTPVFSILLLGLIAAKSKYVSEGAGALLAEFAFKVAMPALLFRATVSIGTTDAIPWSLAAGYFAAIAGVWIVSSLAVIVLLRRPAADSGAIAMSSCFGNTVMLGIPLALSAFGPGAAVPAALLISIETPLLWIIATLQVEAFRRGRAVGGRHPLFGVLIDLVKNPIVMALILGGLVRLSGLTVPPLADRILALLADAAVPMALFALGTSLAAFEIKGQRATLALILVGKMLLQPLFVFAVTALVMQLPPLWIGVATLLAAMPVGANAYLFAARYDTAVRSASGAIAISTVLAVGTVSLVLLLLRQVLPAP